MEQSLKEEVLKFLGTVALSNSGADVLFLSDKSLSIIMSVLAVFHSTTQNDLTVYIHLQESSHINYLHLLRTLNVNPPMDMNTHVIKGEIVENDVGIYDDSVFDCVIIFLDSIVSYASLLPILWNKLKSNSSIIIKGIKHNEEQRLKEFQLIFGSLIVVPSTVHIGIHLIEGTEDIIAIKKPCY